MKNFKSKGKYLLLGIVIGVSFMTSALVFAYSPISAWLSDNVSIYFNGEEKALPEGYEILTYNGRTYTPARFIAEELGAEVVWDEGTKSIYINYDEEVEVPSDDIEDDVIDEKEEEEHKVENDKPSKPLELYKKLPYGHISHEVYITVTNISIEDNITTAYVEVEGRRDVPMQLNQNASKLMVGDKTYEVADAKNVVDPIDIRWYHDIREDERVSGWVKFPPIDKDTEYVTLYLETIKNDGSNEITEFEFDIKL